MMVWLLLRLWHGGTGVASLNPGAGGDAQSSGGRTPSRLGGGRDFDEGDTS